MGRADRVDERPDRGPRPTHRGSRPRHRRRRQRGPLPANPVGTRRRLAARRVPPRRPDREHDGRSTRIFRLGSDPRRARGRLGRAIRRAGRGPGGRGDVERPHGQRQQHGREPHRAGPQHRPGDHGRRQRGPLQEDHGGRPRRDPGVEGHHQHDGRSTRIFRLGSDPRRARGRFRRAFGRASAGARGGRRLERPHG